MKILFTLFTVLLFNPSASDKTYNDFDYDLSRIANDFRRDIMNKSRCEDLKRKADYLSDDIQKYLNEEDIDQYEKDKLRQLKKETEAVEEYIGSVGNCGTYFPKMDDLILANYRINGSILTQLNNKFCVDVITVSINDYVATLAYNKTSANYSIAYKWKLPSGMSSGNGSMGLSSKTVRHMYDNRDKPQAKKIVIVSLNCRSI